MPLIICNFIVRNQILRLRNKKNHFIQSQAVSALTTGRRNENAHFLNLFEP